MKVREAMTSDVSCCQPTASVAAAAAIMWTRDCGVVPVVDECQRVVGMITDRDICIALVTRGQRATELTVGEVIYGTVQTCRPDDSVDAALKTMRRAQLRRLPVINAGGVLVGILSISDVVRRAGKGRDKPGRKQVFAALREISSFRVPGLRFLKVENPEAAEINDESETLHNHVDPVDNEADRKVSGAAAQNESNEKIDVEDDVTERVAATAVEVGDRNDQTSGNSSESI